jgi:drug/metabolite transporter, DME family
MSMITALAAAALTGASLIVSGRDIALAMAMGALLLAVGMALYTLGSKVVPAADLTLLSMLEVLLAPVWVWLVLGETASGATLAGGVLVLGAITFNALSGVRRRPIT